MIHGRPSYRGKNKDDWTAGCIAVRDREMEAIYSMVQAGHADPDPALSDRTARFSRTAALPEGVELELPVTIVHQILPVGS